ncbi:single-stranded DNA-binding protein [Algoriphagus sp. CAU 1675]|uniref:single-stranded DNA-binding protein n=1 Tax=Algoriphagus sp. CAU 1675 TaxID=3032597 RepID=UPI0023DB3598|nr:single-stranded DNA-binding protein [Algoriphagus sp. CAU 1675]MDF2157259.1 single-stranded DNA-binding protein [Algoriphagus sp. CAU 1675]
MNALRNRVQLIGHLGGKVEVKTLDSGKKVGKVSLATHETYKNQKGEKVTETTWHNLVIWGKQVEILEKYTDKGSEIAVEGKLTNRDYTDKEGIKRNITEVVVSDLLLMGNKTDQNA